MTMAENIIELHNTGFADEAARMCEREAIKTIIESEVGAEVEKTYIFSDGSHVTTAYGEMWSL